MILFIIKRIMEKNAIESFDEFGLSNELLKGIYGFGYSAPSIVQKYAIKPILDKKDCVIQEKSGTGKTGAFIISALASINPDIKDVQVIIMNPTREIADQTYKVATEISMYMNINIGLIRGGLQQKYSKNYKEQMLICTPGRLIDIMEKKYLNVTNIKLFVIDEADEMLSKGFLEDMRKIIKNVPSDTQIALFSATMPTEIIELVDTFTDNPVKFLLTDIEVPLDGIKQYYINVEHDEHKLNTILDIYNNISVLKSIIYCNKKEDVEWLASKLKENGFGVQYMHGEMNHTDRTNTIAQFRKNDSRILISTDLLSRGIDIQQLSLVINYDLPYKSETYIHRIGRSGRYGRSGFAINIITNETLPTLISITKPFGIRVNPLPEFAAITTAI